MGFRNDYRNYAGDVFHHGNASPLLAAEKPLTDARYQVNGKTYDLHDYLKRQNVSGMLVLKTATLPISIWVKGIPTARSGPHALSVNRWSLRWLG